MVFVELPSVSQNEENIGGDLDSPTDQVNYELLNLTVLVYYEQLPT